MLFLELQVCDMLQAREEAVQHTTELVCFKKQAARSAHEVEQLQKEVQQLHAQKDAIASTLLQVQATTVDHQNSTHSLQEERDSALASLDTQAGQMQVCSQTCMGTLLVLPYCIHWIVTKACAGVGEHVP